MSPRRLLIGCGLLLAGMTAVVGAPSMQKPAGASVSVPVGFVDSLLTSIPEPTASARVSDGATLVAAKDGTLWRINPDGVKQTVPVLSFADICTGSERGLLGVAPDPNFAVTRHVFVYATRTAGGSCRNRVSRYTMTADGATLINEEVMIDKIPSPAGNHNGGDVKFGKDGLLYISVGDGGCAVFDTSKCAANNPAAQRQDILSGKILRITSDGQIPAEQNVPGSLRCNVNGSNPGGETCAEIYATGLRNPFRIVPDLTASGTVFYINDVGQDTQEEVDRLVGFGNYGWNSWEGACLTGHRTPCDNGIAHAGFMPPVYAYNHFNLPNGGPECGSITGGAVAPAGWDPTGPGTSYLYADLLCDTIFQVSGLGTANVVRRFASGVGPVIDMQMVREVGGWSLYYTTFANGGEVHVVRPSTGGQLPGSGRLVPITPTRVLDTRNSIGTSAGKPKADSVLTFHVPPSVVPDGATAVAVNITGVAPASGGYLTAWPGWFAQPGVSNLNFAFVGETVANAAVLPIRAGGDVNVYVSTSAHVLVDVLGYWVAASSASAGRFVSTTPNRILDTRNGVGAPKALVASGDSRDLQVTGRGGIPADGVSAVAMVVTSVAAAGPGYVTVWPTGRPRPEASSLNPMGADVRANLVIVPVGTNGQISLYSASATDLLVDVAGWFTDDSATTATSGLLQVITPVRVADSRGHSTLAAGEDRPVSFDGVNQSGGREYPVAVTWIYNLTAVDTRSSGYMTAYSGEAVRPNASNVNFEAAGQNRAALAITEVSPGLAARGFLNLYSYATTDYIIDAQAYFLPS